MTLFDIISTHKIAIDIVQHLVGIDIAVVVRRQGDPRPGEGSREEDPHRQGEGHSDDDRLSFGDNR